MDLQSEMHQMRQEQNMIFLNEEQEERNVMDKTNETVKKLNTILKAICKDFIDGDQKLLNTKQTSDSSPGFSLIDSEVPDYRALSFSVTSKCESSHVEIMISDQKWRQVSNFIGNWGNWSDQETIYTGVLDESVIRKKLEGAFLSWYQRVLQRREAVLHDKSFS